MSDRTRSRRPREPHPLEAKIQHLDPDIQQLVRDCARPGEEIVRESVRRVRQLRREKAAGRLHPAWN